MTDRLVYFASGDGRLPHAVRTLATQHLRRLDGKLDALLEKSGTGQMDGYTLAHLEDLKERVTKTLNRIYVNNL